jgi:four helix bundle protein
VRLLESMGRGVRRFNDLRAWQACVHYKRAVYRLCEQEPIASDTKRRGQLEDSVWGPPGHVAEGFGRFSPLDFARFVVMARASLMESQNHLLDFVDRGYITEQQRLELNELAETALSETTGLIAYLQSPEALRNARRAREQRIAARDERRTTEPGTPEPRNPEPGTRNREHTNPEHTNPEHTNPEHTNPEHTNPEPNRNTNPEARTRKAERS